MLMVPHIIGPHCAVGIVVSLRNFAHACVYEKHGHVCAFGMRGIFRRHNDDDDNVLLESV